MGESLNVETATEVEINVEPKKMSTNLFKFGLNLDNLNIILDGMKEQITALEESDEKVYEKITGKPETFLLAAYFERIADSISPAVGKLPHKFKLDDPSFT